MELGNNHNVKHDKKRRTAHMGEIVKATAAATAAGQAASGTDPAWVPLVSIDQFGEYYDKVVSFCLSACILCMHGCICILSRMPLLHDELRNRMNDTSNASYIVLRVS